MKTSILVLVGLISVNTAHADFVITQQLKAPIDFAVNYGPMSTQVSVAPSELVQMKTPKGYSVNIAEAPYAMTMIPWNMTNVNVMITQDQSTGEYKVTVAVPQEGEKGLHIDNQTMDDLTIHLVAQDSGAPETVYQSEPMFLQGGSIMVMSNGRKPSVSVSDSLSVTFDESRNPTILLNQEGQFQIL